MRKLRPIALAPLGLTILTCLFLGPALPDQGYDTPMQNTGSSMRSNGIAGRDGDGELTDGVLNINYDGSASWYARVKSTDDDDAYCTTFSFWGRTSNGESTHLFSWPRICSQTLNGGFQEWSRGNLAVPKKVAKKIRNVHRADHC